jgi:predicted nucleic acid-binding protein
LNPTARLVADCSVVVKWRFTDEPFCAEANDLLLDWQAGAIEIVAPDLLPAEVMSAFLRAARRSRVTEAEAQGAIRDLLALPFDFQATLPLAATAFEIALRFNQRAYDCYYVALAERAGLEFWTGDERLYNALHHHYPLIRWIGDYVPRPGVPQPS